ncbi:hypothetical protein IW261DRAFT_1602125 [Armillaria novae-zelandiae]|uniref:Uncharacterized protein n=1 Tax=Armillaria novae-zelandiae TaxID=153914 RepID=A0AA39PYE9_9AGAR|nr:hypothetical protein IW261DRAFT_1602125 [Armillaria novae-zelandiae]
MTDIAQDGLSALYHTITLGCQTLVYGMYTVIMPICSYTMLRRGLRRKSRILLFGMLVFMFSLSTAYWILTLCNDANLITTWFLHGVSHDLQMPLMNALVLVNYVLTDGVVVWRAWVICRVDYGKSLILPLVFLSLTFLSVLITIGLRIAMTILADTHHAFIPHKGIDRGLDCLQVANLVLSLLTNIFSTSIIGIKAWRNRHWVTSELPLKRKNITTSERIFALLVESGIIYCLSGLVVLISTVIKLPDGTLGDVYTPVNVQFAGIYPAIVLLLVNRQGELNETIVFTSQGQNNAPVDVSNLDTIEFGNNPHANGSSGEAGTFADTTLTSSSEIAWVLDEQFGIFSCCLDPCPDMLQVAENGVLKTIFNQTRKMCFTVDLLGQAGVIVCDMKMYIDNHKVSLWRELTVLLVELHRLQRTMNAVSLPVTAGWIEKLDKASTGLDDSNAPY